MRQTFRQDEAEQILVEAVRRSTEREAAAIANPDVTREKLIEMAGELGVSLETLEAVVHDREIRMTDERAPLGTTDVRRAFLRHRRMEFFAHLGAYLIFNSLVVSVWSLLPYREDFWPKWSILGWAILVLWHGVTLLQIKGDEFERELALWQVKRFRKRSRQSSRRKRRAEREAQT